MPYSKPHGPTTVLHFPMSDPLRTHTSDPQRDNAIKEVKEILSTSPQLSTSPRRKSSAEVFMRRNSLFKVELPRTSVVEEPAILRRKNGDIVKSSLKRSAKSEPTTPMPTTPTPTTPVLPKYVHFGTDLEQIKFFLQFEKPKAVSADVSDEESSDEDDYDDLLFSASEDEEEEEESKIVISLPNFPRRTTVHSQKEVFVDSVVLSEDQKQLVGRVQVANLAFHKAVVVRYTFDFWQSSSEVPAKYSEQSMDRRDKNFDVFVFAVDLIDSPKNPIDGKTMYFAVRYNVNSREYWDNNSGSNYQVVFKRALQQPYPPRQKSRRKSRLRSRPQPDRDNLCRSPPSLASSPPSMVSSLRYPAPLPLSKGRYSMTESLSAEMTKPPTTKSSIQDKSPSSSSTRTTTTTTTIPLAHSLSNFVYKPPSFPNALDPYFPSHFVDGMPGTTDPYQPWGTESKPTERSAPMAIPIGPSKPAIGSSSYFEFVDRYCFYHGPPYAPYSTSPHPLTGSPPVRSH